MFVQGIFLNSLLLLVPQIVFLTSLVIAPARPRKLFAASIYAPFAVMLGFVVGSDLSWRSIPLVYFGIYQLVNMARVVENRHTLPRLQRQVLRSSLVLGGLTFLSLLLRELPTSWIKIVTSNFVYVICLSALAVLVGTLFHLYKSRIRKTAHFYSDEDLPTISVLIPARNEDEELSDCIYSVIKTDYPKLEIIVLDDCSQDNSSDIIKRFAHDGVRFIQGEAPSPKWLAKNQAYNTLSAAASGDWLLFMGVDVRLDSSMLRALITHVLNNEKKMVSVLPRRTNLSITSSLLMPLRYWWELAIPRSIIGHPPVLSTCWLIESKAYHKIGGIAAFAQTVIPESFMARELFKKNAYDFLRSDSSFQITTSKSLLDQYETAVRTRYPQLHRHLEYAALTTLAIIILWISPFIGVIFSAIHHDFKTMVIFFVATVCLSMAHLAVTVVTNPRGWFFALISLPYLFIQEIVLVNLSAYKYEFSEVIWKGRNICYPVMHITPRLPNIDENLPS